MDEIENKKEEIARVISLSLAEGDLNKANAYYFFSFYNKIFSVKPFIFKANDVKNNYYEKIDSLLYKIMEYTGISVKDNFYNKNSIEYSFIENDVDVSDVSNGDVKKAYLLYSKNSKMFLKLGITYKQFIDLYNRYGLEHVFELSKLVSVLKKKSFMYDVKYKLSGKKAFWDFKLNVSELGGIIDKYHIDSTRDLMDFYSELSSFFIDTSNFNEKEKKIVEENKQKFIDRVGNKKIINDHKELKRLKSMIESMYKDKMLLNCFYKANLGDFFDRYKFDFNKENLQKIIKFYIYAYGVSAFQTFTKFDGKMHNFCFFNDICFEQNDFYLNYVILHEFIHTLGDFGFVLSKERFDVRCKYFDEALTHYFAKNACGYLKNNIIEGRECEEKVIISGYECMMPLVDVLKKSFLWQDIIYCKINNDCSLLEERIGGSLMEISNLFDLTYTNYISFNRGEINDDFVKRLENIVNKIEKNNKRYNKK